MEVFGERQAKLSELDLKLDDQKKWFFTNEDDDVVTYGENKLKFDTDRKREICIETLLAFHARKIGTEQDEHESDILYLKFNGDEEVYDSFLSPEKFEDRICWKIDFESDIIQSMARACAEKGKKPFTGVLVHVLQYDSDTTLHLAPMFIHSFELFAEVPLPWVVNNRYDQPMRVDLSCLQKELFFDQGVNVDFYPTENGLEPIILDNEKKLALCAQAIEKVKIRAGEIPENHILIVDLKNGDRDLVSAAFGTLKYEFYKTLPKEDVAEEEWSEKIKDMNNPAVFNVHVPQSEKILYRGVFDWEDRQ